MGGSTPPGLLALLPSCSGLKGMGRRHQAGWTEGHSKGQLVDPCRGLTWEDKLLSMMNEVGSFKQKRR